MIRKSITRTQRSKRRYPILGMLLLAVMCLAGCESQKVESAYLNLNLEDYIVINTDYLDFTYEKPSDLKVSEEEIESAIALALADAAEETENPEGLTKDGDKLDISYVAEAENGDIITKKDGYSITLGKDYLQEKLQKALIGHAVGDVVTVKDRIADDFAYEESLRGQHVIYKITIHKKYDVTVPGLDETFVRENSTAKTVEEYRSQVAEQLRGSKMEEALEEIYDTFWRELNDQAEVLDYPQEQIDQEKDYFYGYVQYLGYSEDDADFDTLSKEYAEDAVKQKLILYKIACDQNLIPTEEEFRDYASGKIAAKGYDEKSFQETFVYDSYTYGLNYGWLEDYLNEEVKKMIMHL